MSCNLSLKYSIDVTGSWQSSTSPLEQTSPSATSEDPAVRKLAAFFSHSEQIRKEASVSLTFDGLQLTLFRDMDEVYFFHTFVVQDLI